jgi:hypothetical protein
MTTKIPKTLKPKKHKVCVTPKVREAFVKGEGVLYKAQTYKGITPDTVLAGIKVIRRDPLSPVPGGSLKSAVLISEEEAADMAPTDVKFVLDIIFDTFSSKNEESRRFVLSEIIGDMAVGVKLHDNDIRSAIKALEDLHQRVATIHNVLMTHLGK